ncbi:hypothetical protein H6G04_34280 [Calothrix membranacea FACHB-236]|nr:hypothetical protein [Calothrix membranacea FACHB-236]
MNRTSAQDRAVSTTLGLIFYAFLLAFVISFILQKILSLLSDHPVKPPEILINFLISFALIGFSAWFSWDRINSTVTSAIQEAAQDEKENIENELKGIRRKIEQEYCCAIPLNIRNTEFQQVGNVPYDFCARRVARDAVIKFLADNDDLLKIIANAGIHLALTQLGQKNITKIDNELFIDDIYAYLKAWLMFSIRYERNMPVEYIKQRYPQGKIPDKEAYVIALEKIKNQVIFDDLEAYLDKRLNTTQKSMAFQIIDESMTELIAELKN